MRVYLNLTKLEKKRKTKKNNNKTHERFLYLALKALSTITLLFFIIYLNVEIERNEICLKKHFYPYFIKCLNERMRNYFLVYPIKHKEKLNNKYVKKKNVLYCFTFTYNQLISDMGIILI